MIFILIFIIIFLLYILLTNDIVMLSRYEILSSKIPESFDGYKIIQISDFHSNARLIDKTVKKIKNESPNIIVITGDLIDRYENFENVEKFLNMIRNIATIYYVTGNHEIYYKRFSQLKKLLNKLNVIILENKNILLKQNNSFINLIGINDISHNKKDIVKVINNLKKDDKYNILLSHRPELFKKYLESKVDLVFSGHAHGGQFRIPFIGGIYSPGQGIFPKYTSGIYKEENTNMIVNRALGDSRISIRINNPRDIVLLTLKSKK